jgi:hypothetical protein
LRDGPAETLDDSAGALQALSDRPQQFRVPDALVGYHCRDVDRLDIFGIHAAHPSATMREKGALSRKESLICRKGPGQQASLCND